MKMIVSDLDGTLLNSDTTISKKNIESIKKAQSLGIQFVLATGRDYHHVLEMAKTYDLQSCMMILGNGAQFVDEKGQLLKATYFPKNQFKNVLAIFKELDIYTMIFTANGFYSQDDCQSVKEAFIHRTMNKFHRTYAQANQGPCTLLQPIDNVDDFLLSHDIIKVEAFDEDTTKIARAKKLLEKIDDIAYLSSFDDNVEVTHQDAQKGLILKEIIQELHIDENEVMVIGDGANDLSLFENFHYSFAPENSQKMIKDLAYCIVKDNEHDAVSDAIEMMLNKENL